MRKEILLAIIVGVLVGLGLTFGLYTLRQQLFPNKTVKEISNSREQNPSPTPSISKNLLIQQPKSGLVTDQDTITVTGRTLPNSQIVILIPDDEMLTTSDQDGDFALEIELQAGGNRITVISLAPDGSREETTLTVVYTTADLSIPDESSSSADNQ